VARWREGLSSALNRKGRGESLRRKGGRGRNPFRSRKTKKPIISGQHFRPEGNSIRKKKSRQSKKEGKGGKVPYSHQGKTLKETPALKQRHGPIDSSTLLGAGDEKQHTHQGRKSELKSGKKVSKQANAFVWREPYRFKIKIAMRKAKRREKKGFTKKKIRVKILTWHLNQEEPEKKKKGRRGGGTSLCPTS